MQITTAMQITITIHITTAMQITTTIHTTTAMQITRKLKAWRKSRVSVAKRVDSWAGERLWPLSRSSKC